MKIQIHRDKLLPVLTRMNAVVDRSQTLPYLSHILLQYNAKQMSCTAKNNEMELSMTLEAEGAQAAQFTLPAKKLLDVCRNIEEGRVLELQPEENGNVVVKASKSRFQLRTLEAEHFPASVLAENPDWSLELPTDVLKRMIQSVSISMALADVRYYLNGMLLDIDQTQLSVVATDAHRLSFASFEMEQAQPEKQSIIPRKSVLELLRSLDQDERVAVQLEERKIWFKGAQWTFMSQLIEGRYPRYQGLVRKDQQGKQLVNRQSFLNALQRVAIVTEENSNRVDVYIKNGVMKLFCRNNQQEEAEEEIPISEQGTLSETSIGFNVRYLVEALRAMTAEEVLFLVEGEQVNATLLDPNDPNQAHIIMPLRT